MYKKLLILIIAFSTNVFAGGIPEIPQIPAFLPTVDNVAATKPMALDGTWLITSIGKKIRIESGRAYAVDGWVHLFTLKIQPGMVVIKNIKSLGGGAYEGEDLPLLGKWSAKAQASRNLSVNVAGTLGPVKYTLVPVQLDKPDWYAEEMAGNGQELPDDDQPPPNEQPIVPTPIDDDEEEPGDEYDDGGDEYEDEEDMQEGEEEFEGEEGEGEEEDVDLEELKVPATKGDRYSCKGKGVYYSKVSGKKYCYTCPTNFKRTSPIRKMNHAKACVNRKGKNKYTKAASRVKNVDGCGKGQFKSKGFCMVCPQGYERFYNVDMYNASYGTNDCVPKS